MTYAVGDTTRVMIETVKLSTNIVRNSKMMEMIDVERRRWREGRKGLKAAIERALTHRFTKPNAALHIEKELTTERCDSKCMYSVSGCDSRILVFNT